MENGKETLEKPLFERETPSDNATSKELERLLEKLLATLAKDLKNPPPPPPPPPGMDPLIATLLAANVMALTALTQILIRNSQQQR
jgi:hypothetical protein